MLTVLRRIEEEFRLPKFGVGSPMSRHNLEVYREVMAEPGGKGNRLVKKLLDHDSLRQYSILGEAQKEIYGVIGEVAFGGRSARWSEPPGDKLPVINGRRNQCGEVLGIMTDDSFTIMAVRTARTYMNSNGVSTTWDEVQFPGNCEMFTRNSESLEPNLDPRVLDHVALAVSMAERKPFVAQAQQL